VDDGGEALLRERRDSKEIKKNARKKTKNVRKKPKNARKKPKNGRKKAKNALKRKSNLANNKRKNRKNRVRKPKGRKSGLKNKKKKNGRRRKAKGMKKRGKDRNKQNGAKQSCSSEEVSLTCMKDALEGMMFEKNQITNYLKQAKRLENHGTISTNKVGKKGEFEEARKHLLWAIGGDISDPKCGPNTTAEQDSTIDYEFEKNLALEGLAVLANCSVAIEAACNVSKLEGYEQDAYSENITLCRSMMSDAIANSKACQALTDSVTDQCKCWANQSILVGRIKQFNCLAKSTQKLVTAHKNECIKVFGTCKKKEDATVEAVYSCMNDHSMGFINQSLDSLAVAAVEGTKAENRVREFHLLSI